MEPEAGQYRHDDVAHRGSGQNIREIGEGERGQVRSEKSGEQDNAGQDPRRDDRMNQRLRMRKRNRWKRLHATRQACIAERGGERDQGKDEIATEGHWPNLKQQSTAAEPPEFPAASVLVNLSVQGLRSLLLGLAFPDETIAFGAQFEERLRFDVQALYVTIGDGLAD